MEDLDMRFEEMLEPAGVERLEEYEALLWQVEEGLYDGNGPEDVDEQEGELDG